MIQHEVEPVHFEAVRPRVNGLALLRGPQSLDDDLGHRLLDGLELLSGHSRVQLLEKDGLFHHKLFVFIALFALDAVVREMAEVVFEVLLVKRVLFAAVPGVEPVEAVDA